MMKRIGKTRHKCRQAFTLVELIIVLVILAVLAAMLVPALTGYIKKAKKEKYVETVHYAQVAAQSVMTEVYGLSDGNADEDQTEDGNNVIWYEGTEKEWGDKVLKLMDRGRGEENGEPYILIVGVGNHKDTAGMTPSQRYTVYYVCYIEKADSPAVFFVNGEFMYKYPRKDNGKVITTKKIGGENFRNTIVKDNANIPLQFYIISNLTGDNPSDSKFWTGAGKKSLLGHSEGYA
ncbi:MAG: type II secretion system protein [Clostridiales bacterium]|nr:type II secretion system protein [Clostridiales bacterium]